MFLRQIYFFLACGCCIGWWISDFIWKATKHWNDTRKSFSLLHWFSKIFHAKQMLYISCGQIKRLSLSLSPSVSLSLSLYAVIHYLLNFNSKWCANTYLMYNELDNSITMTFVTHLQYFRLIFFFFSFSKLIFVAFGITLLINESQLCSKRNVHQLKHFSFNALLARVYMFKPFLYFL